MTFNAKENSVCRDVTSFCLVGTYRRLRGNRYSVYHIVCSGITEDSSHRAELKLESVNLFRCESRRNLQIAIFQRTGSILERTVVALDVLERKIILMVTNIKA